MKLVCDGFLLKREDPIKKDLYIQLINFSTFDKKSESVNESESEFNSIAADAVKIIG